jgi:hypothetical protein
MKEQIQTKNQDPLTVVVRIQDDSMVFRVATLKELTDKMEAWRDIDPCRITIFRDREMIRTQISELCHRIEALSDLINPEEEASDISRCIGSTLLADMTGEMSGLSLAETVSKATC